MCKIAIKFNKNITAKNSLITKNEYIAVDFENGFEAVVTVSEHSGNLPYVSQIQAVKNEEKLNCFKYWSDLQIKVLTFHNLVEFHNEIKNE